MVLKPIITIAITKVIFKCIPIINILVYNDPDWF